MGGHRWGDEATSTGWRDHPAEYGSWSSMRKRCLSKNDDSYPDYGGRGITICDRWNKFDNFYADMGHKPTPKHTIEREDNNGNYEPMNCKWATYKEQGRNRRNTVFVEYQGKKELLIDLCERLGLTKSVIYGRLKNGWDIEDALTKPTHKKKLAGAIVSVP